MLTYEYHCLFCMFFLMTMSDVRINIISVNQVIIHENMIVFVIFFVNTVLAIYAHYHNYFGVADMSPLFGV